MKISVTWKVSALILDRSFDHDDIKEVFNGLIRNKGAFDMSKLPILRRIVILVVESVGDFVHQLLVVVLVVSFRLFSEPNGYTLGIVWRGGATLLSFWIDHLRGWQKTKYFSRFLQLWEGKFNHLSFGNYISHDQWSFLGDD